jgi:hypothetical protein
MQRYRGITFPFLEASRNLSALSTEPKKPFQKSTENEIVNVE